MTRNVTLTRIKTFWQSTSGTALVEFVIVFPMMILFFAIMVEFGRLYWGYQSVVAGVRDAARYVGRVGPVDVCVDHPTANPADLLQYLDYVTEDDIEEIVEEERVTGTSVLPIQFAVDVDGVTATYTCPEADSDAVSWEYRTPEIPLATVSVQVTMQFPLGHLFSLFGDVLGSVTTTVSDQARIFGG